MQQKLSKLTQRQGWQRPGRSTRTAPAAAARRSVAGFALSVIVAAALLASGGYAARPWFGCRSWLFFLIFLRF